MKTFGSPDSSSGPTRFIIRTGHNVTPHRNFCQYSTPKTPAPTHRPTFLDLTDLLENQLIAAGFRLFDDKFGQHLVFGGKDIHRHPVDTYSLKAIKRYCRLYLREKTSS